MHRPRIRADLLAATAFVLAATMACVSVDLGSSSAPPSAALASGAAVVEASDAPSIGPKRTRKPRRNPPSAPPDTTQPTSELTTPPTEPPTAPPTLDPNATPFCCFTFHLPPIDGFPSGLVLQPIDPLTLDYTKPPNYGEANLGAAFTPDPYSVGMTSGGPVDVSYLGSSCNGFASQAPDLRINYSGGGAALLRLYFISASGDTTMVVNDPYGNYYCVDDSFGTVNPTIDFNNPANGTYDVWIGSYASGTNVSGTMYATENSGNHP